MAIQIGFVYNCSTLK